MNSNQKTKILMVISILTLLVLVTGATFAYFTAQGGTGAQTNINVTTHTTDMLTFATSAPITITADQETFASGKGNREGTTTASATLRANSKTNSATEHYNLYLDITNNTFEYTTDTKTAELILTIKNPEGNVVTSINGLDYVTVGEVSGFDVTEYNNLITIANNKEIVSTGTKIEEWEVKLTLINLDSNQNANTGKTFNASLLIQKEEKTGSFANYIIGLYTTDGENNLYYHDGVGTYTNADEEAGDYSYRYAGGDYTIAPAHQETYKRIARHETTDTDALIGYICGTAERLTTGTIACNEETQYFYLTYEEAEPKTQYATYKEALAKAIADGYVIETPVKNYVCFGSNEKECPYDSLYRIIGVFDGKAKLIKADYASKKLLGEDGDAFIPESGKTEQVLSLLYNGNLNGMSDTFYWNKTNSELAKSEAGYSNVWSYSELNKTNLNKNFLNNIGEEWSSKILQSTWYVGGMDAADLNLGGAKTKYSYEVGDNKIVTAPFEPYSAKVGLLYASDYYYSVSPNYWGKDSKYDGSRDSNWLFLGGHPEYTISRGTTAGGTGFVINAAGSLARVGGFHMSNRVVRPTFYLNSSVEYVSGTGTETDPYRIS